MAAIIGNRDVMQAAQSTFISSTYWTEHIGPAAAPATFHKHRRCNVHLNLHHIGQMGRDGWQVAAQRTRLSILTGGLVPLSSFAVQHEQSQAAHTLFTQLTLDKGSVATKTFYTTFAHRDELIEEYLQEVDGAFGTIAEALERGTVSDVLRGPVTHTGFARLN